METARRGIFQLLPIRDVHYGPGCIAGLGKALADHNIRRALLVTGTTLATQTDLVAKVRDAADGRIAAVFHDTIQHVHRGSVLAAADRAREIDADGIVSFGGGTPNDTGKAIVMALAEDLREPADFDALRVRFTYPASVEVPSMHGKALPMIAVSTTLSGGEFTHFAGVTDDIRRVKDLYINEQLAARSVFMDPELTLATPLWLWLSTGMRSVDHCIEALCSANAHPFTDALAEHALATLARTLRRCREAPQDLAARTDAHIAAWMSVCGLANVNLGLSHGIGHQLGARNNVPHGVTSCVMMPAVMAFNRSHVPQRQQRIAQLLGRDIQTLSLEEGATAAAEAVAELVRDLELPGRLREVGVMREDFMQLARDAMEDIIVATNPRPVQSVEEVIAVLEAAY